MTYAQQASYLRTAVAWRAEQARADADLVRVRDNPVNLWQSGLLTYGGLEKPAFDLYSVSPSRSTDGT